MVLPTISSPRSNVPTALVSVISGAIASVLDDSESNTATRLNASARPNEIVVSVGRVPNASVVPETTFICFINFVVLDF